MDQEGPPEAGADLRVGGLEKSSSNFHFPSGIGQFEARGGGALAQSPHEQW